MSQARQERKVVTVLFADLVGFTSRAEQMDPEDVAAILATYHRRLRTELERFGGTVEKFIGDAVMAVFGAPVAHEDDPERAVRAALAIRDWVLEEEQALEVRIGVNTGEALVTLAPREGEGMAAGDVVNTAARLQAAAPVNGILVDVTTYRATRDAVEYRDAPPVDAKGKAEPVAVWEAVQARSSVGVDVEQEGRAPLVGRAPELDVLLNAFARSRQDRSPQLVTLVGVPGIGKSRLVWELFQTIERDPDLVYWRQGRCLPYGEGVAYWAVGEMVKAQAGILDTDSAEEAGAKLESAAASAAGEDGTWVNGHLRPLIGLADEDEMSDERRLESFAAWRRFFEGLADQRPLVLVFEDLHWADEGLFDFVDHVVDWATGSPLLVVCTARPEFIERRPGWGGGKLNATTLALSPLSDEDAARLVAALVGQTLLPAETQAALLARAGGNPLYAEQYVRMFIERGSARDLPLPENVQGIIAARLDALPPREKALLQDAAVLGKVFWPGALRAIGGSDSPEELLHALERKEFARRERRSSVGGEAEHAFRHMLVRDVAYGQIPRAERAEKHRQAAAWIESLSERTDDVAEMLAYHYASALEFARASGQDTSDLTERARHALRRAGDRALALSAFRAADGFHTAALELWPADDPERAELQLELARSRNWTGKPYDGLLVEARAAFLADGRLDLAARAEAMLSLYRTNRGEADLAELHLAEALKLAESAPRTRHTLVALELLARRSLVSGDYRGALERAQAAVETAEELDAKELRAQALITLGYARFALGDVGGVSELERGLEIGEKLSSGEIVVRARKNLGDYLRRTGDLAGSVELHERGLETARRIGDTYNVRWFSVEIAYDRYLHGRWDESLALAEEVIDVVETGSPHYMEAVARQLRAVIRLARGDEEGALVDSSRQLERGRSSRDLQAIWPALAVRARVLAACGKCGEASVLLEELERLGSRVAPGEGAADLAFAAAAAGRPIDFFENARSLMPTPWVEAGEAVCSGEFVRAADAYAELGSRPDEASARLLAARALVEVGRRAEADEQLRPALNFFREVGATAYAREAESLLSASA